MWAKLRELEDPLLKSLASRLPITVLKGRADNTTVKYLYAYGWWRRWADEHHVPQGLPVSEIHLVGGGGDGRMSTTCHKACL